MSTTPPVEGQRTEDGAEKDEPLAFSGVGIVGGIFLAPVIQLARLPRMFRLYSMAPVVRVAIVIVVLGMLLLVGNEVYSARKIGRLGDLQKSIVTAPADKVDASLDGRVVHVVGVAKAASPVTDPDTNVSADALRLLRKVEMLQWKQTKGKKTGDPAVYDKVWSETPISSVGFEDRSKSNPASMPLRSKTWPAAGATVGAYTLSGDLAAQVPADQGLEVAAAMLERMPESLKTGAKLDAPYLYVGEDSSNGHVGDVRISYKVAQVGQTVSVVATQHGSRLGGGDGDAETLKVGSFSSGELVAHAQGKAGMIAWAVRVLGALIIYGGLALLYSTTAVFGELVMVAGNVITLGFQAVKVIFTIVLAGMAIGLGWGVMHPLIGSPVLAIVVVLVVMGVMRAKTVDV